MSDIARNPERDLRDTGLEQAQLTALLLRLWRTPDGWLGSLTSVDHKVIGKRYILTAFAFLVLGGLLAVLMRLQLAGAERKMLSPDLYNQRCTGRR
jgi:cytochrome c oxidase subunit 1